MVHLLGQRQFEMGVRILGVLESFLKDVNLLVGESHPAGCTLSKALNLVLTLRAFHLWDKLGPAKHGWDGYESMLFIIYYYSCILVTWESPF